MDLTFANANSERRFFFLQDQDLIRGIHEQEHLREERDVQRLHWMKCPRCGHDLKTSRLQSLSVERCEGCGGAFFDQSQIQEYFGTAEPSESFIETLHRLMVGDAKSS